MAERDSLGPLRASPQKSTPLARSKNDPKTFAKPDAYALVGRLAAQWPFMVSDPGREDILAAEYVAQFDGYAPHLVERAVTIAVGKATKGPPSAGEIKAELRLITAPRSARTEHKADDDQWVPHPASEIARRAAFMLQMRKQYPGMFRDNPPPSEDTLEDLKRPLSDSELESAKRLMKREV